jgi:hypothetical protein
MPERVACAFDAYIALGHRRSLKALEALGDGQWPSRAIATLKRWSVRYKWQQRLVAHERKVVAQMQSRFVEAMQRRVSNDLEAIEAAKERFYARVLLDPNDPNLTAAERKRALKPTLRDFLKLLRAEQLVWSTGMATSSITKPQAAEERYTDEELEAMLRALAQVRHGLPP